MSMKVKKIKCPVGHDKFDPTVTAVTDGLSHCSMKRCGLENINLDKLEDDVPTDMLYLDYEEPLEIHMYSADHKTVT